MFIDHKHRVRQSEVNLQKIDALSMNTLEVTVAADFK
jgi:hypothetical protein